jgi:nitrile hydratase
VDGAHDLGGMHGFGPVPFEVDEPLFHEAWEGRVWAMLSAVREGTTIDRFRFTIELAVGEGQAEAIGDVGAGG